MSFIKIKRIKQLFKSMKNFLKYIFYSVYIIFKKVKKGYWIICERGTDAGDNGYFFFKYLRENHPEIDVKYIISKNSPDYEKVNKLGNIIQYGSKEHFISNLVADKLISTHLFGYAADTMAYKAYIILFGKNGKLISLKHGITKDYISFLDANKTKLDMICSVSKKEYNYMLRTYNYSKEQLKLTGFARYDSLISNTKKIILIMPTWRKGYNGELDFKDTDFYKKYQSLINNKKLIKNIEDMGYSIVFYVHYELLKYSYLFNSYSKNVVIYNSNANNVQKMLKESNILITDYSSVFFDFAYMKKPVIYYQFDYDFYRQHHYKEGYFSYAIDGFGPVLMGENEVIDYTIKLLNNNSYIENKYLQRINNFYIYNDKNNCQRIYDSIQRLH